MSGIKPVASRDELTLPEKIAFFIGIVCTFAWVPCLVAVFIVYWAVEVPSWSPNCEPVFTSPLTAHCK